MTPDEKRAEAVARVRAAIDEVKTDIRSGTPIRQICDVVERLAARLVGARTKDAP